MKLIFSNTILKQRGQACNEDCRITQTQEGLHVKIKNQGHADHFFDQKCMVHRESVPEGETVNQHFYQQVLICLLN